MPKQDFSIQYASGRTSVSPLPFQTNQPPRIRHTWYREIGKPVLDIIIVLLLLPIALPLIGMFSLLVALDGSSPFYQQNRIGKNGRVFRMWKLRTMVPNAETKLEAHLATSCDARSEWEAKQKLQDDPRITTLGRMLRRSSMDELPQIFNVLMGQMSIVGPRPMLESQKDLYPGRSYYALRPGMTGPWQVSDRNGALFADRARFDDAYHQQLSVGTDLRLIAETAKVVLRGTGC